MERAELRGEINRLLLILMVVASIAAVAVAITMHLRSQNERAEARRAAIQSQYRELEVWAERNPDAAIQAPTAK